MGSEITVRCLEEQGIKYVFCFPGGVVIPLFDAFYRLDHNITQIGPCHEQNGVHAADGYARTSGTVGVAITTSGPGATNAITGIANAYLDSVPLVVITGQVASPLLGKDSFQEIDITSVTMEITKHNYLVTKVEKLADTIREAFVIAQSGRPGPVVIDIPKDIFMAKTDYQWMDIPKLKQNHPKLNEDKIAEAIAAIKAAKNPVIYAGGGVLKSKASEELLAFAEKSGVPVANSLMGLGGIPRDHELSLGMVGMHGFQETNLAVINSDLLIAIGARFSDRVTGNCNAFVRNKKIVHIDVDPTEFAKNIPAEIQIQGNIKDVLPLLTQGIEKKVYPEWYEKIKNWIIPCKIQNAYNPKNILNTINAAYPEAYVVTEVGQHQMWVGQYWNVKRPAQFVTSGGLGTMGYGLGAAMGVKLANPDSDVLLIAGDGSFRMNCQELITVSKYKIPIKIFLFDNEALGMVRQWQKLFSEKRYAETDIVQCTDYLMLAAASGIPGYKVTTMAEMADVLEKIKDQEGPLLVHVKISNEEGVYPIVPAGCAIDEIYYE
ncbi:biosynthetic-type acetolactate synthase large subunit [Acetobacterium bakii]|uniref:Acetolactate synthase n=1 Tax=Acetobacterium bakii TaxID=52689 RepID=A0A0L6U3C4_9FIRM|nr:acetolactate synthase catalytic subunit [Acetobacterium bakii]